MKILHFVITVVISMLVALGASFGYIKYVKNANPEGYVLDPNSSITRVEIENIVKEFVLDNPELIVESVDRMNSNQAQKEKDRIDAYINSNIESVHKNPNNPRYGKKGAKLKIVEFFDYRCGYCKRMMSVKDQAVANNLDVEFIFVEFPILGEFSEEASKAALAINIADSSKYIDYHREMLNHNGPVDENTIPSVVAKIGISSEQFAKYLKNPKIKEILEDNKKLARGVGVMGSPAYIIGKEYYPGAMSYEELEAMVKKSSN